MPEHTGVEHLEMVVRLVITPLNSNMLIRPEMSAEDVWQDMTENSHVPVGLNDTDEIDEAGLHVELVSVQWDADDGKELG